MHICVHVFLSMAYVPVCTRVSPFACILCIGVDMGVCKNVCMCSCVLYILCMLV